MLRTLFDVVSTVLAFSRDKDSLTLFGPLSKFLALLV